MGSEMCIRDRIVTCDSEEWKKFAPFVSVIVRVLRALLTPNRHQEEEEHPAVHLSGFNLDF